MATRTDDALILRLTEFSESSQIVTLLTRQAGLLKLIARGIRRGTRTRFASGLDLLEIGELTFAPPRGDAQLGTLAGWAQRDALRGLRGSATALYGGLYVAELLSVLLEEQDPAPALFDDAVSALRELATGAAAAPVVVRFQRALLSAIGYAPALDRCVSCGHTPPRGIDAHFSASAGGLICRDCELHYVEKRRLGASLVAGDLTTSNVATWFELFDYYLTYLAAREFRTSQVLGQLLTENRRS
ncbi:MAG: DNA repair protein RecO [Phycisphaerae bacterium]|nr:DNA repair protein RecO [Phycisphaerae bacterium]